LVNAPDSLRSGTIQGVDLDQILIAARNQARGDENPAAPVFIAFASTAMPEESLKRMIADVSAAGGTVVFRGFLPDGSKSFMAQLQKLVSTQQSAHVKIDPRLFRAFEIEDVPAYVALPSSFPLCDTPDCTSSPPDFDKISGNVTTAYALQTFADGAGPGAAVARTALAKLGQPE
jgi:conjugal transfer pilus assembly protein TrbC